MKTTEIWKKFLEFNDGMSEMAEAVIDQLGGINTYSLQTLNSVRNGADGYGGFIYYNELFKWWKLNRETVIKNMDELADDIGDHDAWTLIHNFNAFRDGRNIINNKDLALALYGDSDACEDGYLVSVLCWYALEEVSNRFQDFVYEEDIDLNEVEESEEDDEQ